MMQSISTHFRLSANHADKQVMLHVSAKQQEMCKLVTLVMFKTAIILTKFLIDQNNIY